LGFIFGTIIQSMAKGYGGLMLGRSFVGYGVGFGLAVDPVYIGEISQAAHRGRLVTWSEIATNVGILLGFVSGLAFADVDGDRAWRWMFALGAILPCFVIYFSVSEMCVAWGLGSGEKRKERGGYGGILYPS
jgi:MFS family permease